MTDVLIAVLLGFVEGLTEFVPVSSTGHLILVGDLVGFEGDKAATFEVVIQLGAILAVAWLYRRRLLALCTRRRGHGFAGPRGLGLLMLTTAPALVLGALAHGVIKDRLFNPFTVALGLAAGGVALIVVERRGPRARRDGLDALRWQDALLVGACQCLALWPGVSRSAATIVGGMIGGIGRTTAAEYSFLAAIPVITAAALFDLAQGLDTLVLADVPIFAVGFVTAFAFAWLAVGFFLRYLGRATLAPFGWYRVGLALVVLLVLGAGHLRG
jgi:undecaprenyl-diphosphatase